MTSINIKDQDKRNLTQCEKGACRRFCTMLQNRLWINRFTATGVGIRGWSLCMLDWIWASNVLSWQTTQTTGCAALVRLWLSSFSQWQWGCNRNSTLSSRTPVEEKQKLGGIMWKNLKILKISYSKCLMDTGWEGWSCLVWQRGERLQGNLTVAYYYLKSCYSDDGSKLFPVVAAKRQRPQIIAWELQSRG